MKKKDNTELITQKAAKAPKSGKTLKGQLFSAVAMMLVATIALGSSTYAWFINNRTVKVENINLTVQTASALQVAVQKSGDTSTGGHANFGTAGDTGFADGAKFYTPYKNVLANPDITGRLTDDSGFFTEGAGWLGLFRKPMIPASASNKNIPVDTFYLSDGSMGDQFLTNFTKLTRTTTTGEYGGDGVKKIPLRFLASSDMPVFFNVENNLTFDDLLTVTNAADGTPTNADMLAAIKKAIRIAVVPYGDANVAPTNATTPLVFQFDDGAAHLTGSNYNTDFSKVTTINDVTTYTAGAGATYDAIKALQKENLGSYAAVSGLVGAGNGPEFVLAVGTQQTKFKGLSGGDATNYTLINTAAGVLPTDAAGKTPLFSLKANEAKDVDIYIWLEGTDQDCISALSTYKFAVKLGFAGFVANP